MAGKEQAIVGMDKALQVYILIRKMASTKFGKYYETVGLSLQSA